MTSEAYVSIRPVTEEDKNFIYSSWLKSYRSSPSMRLVANELYYAAQHRVIDSTMKSANCLVLCDNNDKSGIYGYIVFSVEQSVPVVHWMYVKHFFRKFGFGKKLLERAGVGKGNLFCYTHHSKAGESIAAKLGGFYNPFLQGSANGSTNDAGLRIAERGVPNSEQHNTAAGETNPNTPE